MQRNTAYCYKRTLQYCPCLLYLDEMSSSKGVQRHLVLQGHPPKVVSEGVRHIVRHYCVICA